ncbi:hypothetical protein IW262DRAFT_1526641 [Armillaria fumosa]|nr:hypothetical protein IW262DRAFT_1526641 [Armillaria fumosa]
MTSLFPHFRLLTFTPWLNIRPLLCYLLIVTRFCTVSASSQKNRATTAHLGGRLTWRPVKFHDKRQGNSNSVETLAFYQTYLAIGRYRMDPANLCPTNVVAQRTEEALDNIGNGNDSNSRDLTKWLGSDKSDGSQPERQVIVSHGPSVFSQLKQGKNILKKPMKLEVPEVDFFWERGNSIDQFILAGR